MLVNSGFRNQLQRAVIRLARRPVISGVVVITLAIGIGLNTAMFSILETSLFPRVAYPEADRLTIIQTQDADGQYLGATSYPRYREWATDTKLLQIAGTSTQDVVVADGEALKPITGEFVSASYFPVLGVTPTMGRSFTSEEVVPSGPRVAVLSADLWKEHFGLDKNLEGKTIKINDELFSVVGVMPKGMHGLSRKARVWLPITSIGVVSTPDLLQNNVAIWVVGIGRLRPQISSSQAESELVGINAHFDQIAGNSNTKSRIRVRSLRNATIENYRVGMILLCATSFIVLLIACVNVSMVLLAYFVERSPEFAVRQAFGAEKRDFVWQLGIESSILSVAGGITGLVLTLISTKWLRVIIAGVFPGSDAPQVGWQGLLFALLLSIVMGSLLGILFGHRMYAQPLLYLLREGSRMSVGGQRIRKQSLIIVTQLSLAMSLVIVAGLMVRTMINYHKVHLGFDPDHVLVLKMSTLPSSAYDTVGKMTTAYENMIDALKRRHGIREIGAITSVPLLSPSPTIPFVVHGRPVQQGHQPPVVNYLAIQGRYFETMGTGLLQGRLFDSSDRVTSQPVAIVNKVMAQQYWPGQSVVGQQITIWDGGPERQVVGVVDDVRDVELKSPSSAQVYIPLSQVPQGFASMLRSFPPALLLKTESSDLPFTVALKNALKEADPNVTVISMTSLTDVLTQSVAAPRLYRNLLLVFAGLALALAIIGVFGMLARSAAQRTKEIGIRVALGASKGQIVLLTLKPAAVTIVVSIAVGAFVGWLLGNTMKSLVFGVAASDTAIFFLSGFAVTLTAMAASCIVAQRALRVDPNEALRYE